MKILNDFFEDKIDVDTAITIGKFDSFHRGHQILIDDILSIDNLSTTIVTFKSSPNIKLNKKKDELLVTNEERTHYLEHNKISYLVLCDFNERFMNTSPRDFIHILSSNYNMKYLIVGCDFTFGKGGKGNIDLLKSLSKEYSFTLKVIDKIKEDGEDISSSLIRKNLKNGNIERVNKLLGYPYFIYSQVEKGKGLGKKIHVPTINLKVVDNKILPPNGVYITETIIGNKKYKGLTNIGIRPTIADDNHLTIENNLLDFYDTIYLKDIKILFYSYLRKEIKFKSLNELTLQIKKDQLMAYKFFEGGKL